MRIRADVRAWAGRQTVVAQNPDFRGLEFLTSQQSRPANNIKSDFQGMRYRHSSSSGDFV
jgi:hypothetical protein